MTTARFAFPLDSVAFASALRTGHGRALQQVQRYGVEGLDDTLIDACVRCGTYDPQCEAPRAPWLSTIVECAGLQTRLVQAFGVLLQKAPTEDDDHRDLELRSAMLRELAAAGSIDARRLLYASLVRLPGTSADVIAADDIVALDGIEGLLHVARQMGRWSLEDPRFWVDDRLVEECRVSTDVPNALAALEREAASDPHVARYIQALAEMRAASSSGAPNRPNTAAFTGGQIVAHAQDSPKDPCYWFRRWGVQARASELEIVFQALVETQVPELAMRLLRCFSQRAMPRFDSRLLPWLDHPDPMLGMAAMRAMRFIRHPALRVVALGWIADGDMASGVRLLSANFEPGDYALCVARLQSVNDIDARHELGSSLVALCEAHPSVDALDCLLDVYELSPCSTCRREAVKVLVGLDLVPDWLRQEACFDADPQTRALLSVETVCAPLGVHRPSD